MQKDLAYWKKAVIDMVELKDNSIRPDDEEYFASAESQARGMVDFCERMAGIVCLV